MQVEGNSRQPLCEACAFPLPHSSSEITRLPGRMFGEQSGVSSTATSRMPSLGRSGCGLTTSREIPARKVVSPVRATAEEMAEPTWPSPTL